MASAWQTKCVKDTAKALLPCQRQLRNLKDSLLGYRREPQKDTNTIRDGLKLLSLAGDVRGKNVLEIGTGWQPMIPILFSLSGATVFLTDLYPLMRPETFRAALEAIRENRDEIARHLHLAPVQIDHAARDCRNEDMAERLNELRLNYLAPCDCRHLALETGSMDIVMSRAVLEHVPPPVIAAIFQEAHRLLRSGGTMLHLVDPSDHWSHRDKRITAINFLRYPDWLFRLTCINPQNYQNRLRHSQYRSLLEQAGFTLTSEEQTVDPQSLAALKTIPLAPRFRAFAPDDLATVESLLLAKA